MSEPAVEIASEPAASEPAATPAAEPAAAPETPSAAPNSFSMLVGSLPEELRGAPAWKQYEERGFEGMAKDFIEQSRLIGSEERVSRPKPDAPAEDWERFYNTLGRPEKPEDYDLGDFTPPEGLPWSEDQQQRLTARMHEIGLTNDQMSKAIRALAEEQHKDYEAGLSSAVEAREQSEQQLRTEWGAAFDAKMTQAEQAWVYAFGEAASQIGEVELPGLGKFGAIPAVVKAFAKIGESMSEDKLVDGKTQANGAMTQGGAQAEYNRMLTDPTISKILADPQNPEHGAMKRRWDQVAAMAFPD